VLTGYPTSTSLRTSLLLCWLDGKPAILEPGKPIVQEAAGKSHRSSDLAISADALPGIALRQDAHSPEL
jgi:hypothetical protein